MTELTISEIRVIEWGDEATAPTDETLAAGDACRFDVTDGQLTAANGTTATEASFFGLVTSVDAGQIATAAGNGSLVTLGTALASINYGAYVYLDDTDKKLTDTSGESTETKIFGIVEAVHQHGTVYKALRILKGDS